MVPACSLLVGTAGGAPVTTNTMISNITYRIPDETNTELDVKLKKLCEQLNRTSTIVSALELKVMLINDYCQQTDWLFIPKKTKLIHHCARKVTGHSLHNYSKIRT
jgi:hypothetical protein